jgi:hypothetical protein
LKLLQRTAANIADFPDFPVQPSGLSGISGKKAALKSPHKKFWRSSMDQLDGVTIAFMTVVGAKPKSLVATKHSPINEGLKLFSYTVGRDGPWRKAFTAGGFFKGRSQSIGLVTILLFGFPVTATANPHTKISQITGGGI